MVIVSHTSIFSHISSTHENGCEVTYVLLFFCIHSAQHTVQRNLTKYSRKKQQNINWWKTRKKVHIRDLHNRNDGIWNYYRNCVCKCVSTKWITYRLHTRDFLADFFFWLFLVWNKNFALCRASEIITSNRAQNQNGIQFALFCRRNCNIDVFVVHARIRDDSTIILINYLIEK